MPFPAKIGLFLVLLAIGLFTIQFLEQGAVEEVTETGVPITNVANTVRPENAGAAPSVVRKVATKRRSTSKRKVAKRTLTDPNSKHAKLLGKRTQLGTPGKWTVLHFWATWCGSCVEASPDLVKLHAKYAPHGVEFFGVNLDKDPGAMTKYMSKVGMAWPQMVTTAGWESRVRLEHQVPSIPAVYLVSPNGQVVEAGIRGFEDGDARLLHHLKRARRSTRQSKR